MDSLDVEMVRANRNLPAVQSAVSGTRKAKESPIVWLYVTLPANINVTIKIETPVGITAE
jgi:hypothetical protein